MNVVRRASPRNQALYKTPGYYPEGKNTPGLWFVANERSDVVAAAVALMESCLAYKPVERPIMEFVAADWNRRYKDLAGVTSP